MVMYLLLDVFALHCRNQHSVKGAGWEGSWELIRLGGQGSLVSLASTLRSLFWWGSLITGWALLTSHIYCHVGTGMDMKTQCLEIGAFSHGIISPLPWSLSFTGMWAGKVVLQCISDVVKFILNFLFILRVTTANSGFPCVKCFPLANLSSI